MENDCVNVVRPFRDNEAARAAVDRPLERVSSGEADADTEAAFNEGASLISPRSTADRREDRRRTYICWCEGGVVPVEYVRGDSLFSPMPVEVEGKLWSLIAAEAVTGRESAVENDVVGVALIRGCATSTEG